MKGSRRTKSFFAGVAMLGRGMRTWGTSPALMGLGLLPAVITVIVFAIAIVALISNLEAVAQWLALRITDDGGVWLGLLTAVISLALIAASIVVVIYTFTAVTLTIGGPFFEKLSRRVDRMQGIELEEVDERWWKALRRNVGEGLRLGLVSVGLGICLFLVGLIPVVGAVTAVAIGAAVGGWFLALELTAYPLARRGVVRLRDRRALLARHRALTVGFGVAVFLVFLVPLGAVLAMPAAVAGGTLLARRVYPEGLAHLRQDHFTHELDGAHDPGVGHP